MERKQKTTGADPEASRFAATGGVGLPLAKKALSGEAMISPSSQMVVENLSGNYYENLSMSILPGSTTVIIGDNVRARSELARDLGDPNEGVRAQAIHMPKNSEVLHITPTITDNVDGDISIKDFFLSARGIADIEERLSKLWELASGGDESALQQAGELQEKFDNADGWSAEQEISQILKGLSLDDGINDTISLDRKMSELSSGQISKVIIGSGLYSRANVLVMDNPSVHLDVQSKEWLAAYIKQSSRAIIVATSDMTFAESVGDRVIEILDNKLTLNIGTGVSNYYEERRRLIDSWRAEAVRAKEAIHDLEIQIRDFFGPAAKRTDNMAQVLRAQTSKLERMKAEYNQMPGKIILDTEQKQKSSRRFEVKDRSGNDVVSIRGLQAVYESSDNDHAVIDIPSLDIRRKEKVALIGKNGSGKSTLMKVLAGDDSEMIVDGECKLGASIEVGYYSPTTDIPAQRNETIMGATTKLDAHPSGILRYWGFNDGDSYKTATSELKEDDEKARMQLALIMAQKPNLLLLDEPTSYLTPSYQEKLAEALKDYEGTMIVISHNPDFLEKLGLTSRIVMPKGEKETF